MRQLSKTQQDCLLDVTDGWQSARELGYRINTLCALKKHGLVEWSRGNGAWQWRLTDAGAKAKIEAREALR